MPKIDVAAVPKRKGTGYPQPFAAASIDRIRQRLGDAGGLSDFGVNLMQLPPGNWSSQRHWHSHEDEFVYVLEGEVTLVTDGGAQLLRPGQFACFKGGSQDAHHFVNRSGKTVRYLEVGSRISDDVAHYPDDDLMWVTEKFIPARKDGTRY